MSDSEELDPFGKVMCETDHCENMVAENETVECENCGKKFCPVCVENEMFVCENCGSIVCNSHKVTDLKSGFDFCSVECKDEWFAENPLEE